MSRSRTVLKRAQGDGSGMCVSEISTKDGPREDRAGAKLASVEGRKGLLLYRSLEVVH